MTMVFTHGAVNAEVAADADARAQREHDGVPRESREPDFVISDVLAAIAPQVSPKATGILEQRRNPGDVASQ